MASDHLPFDRTSSMIGSEHPPARSASAGPSMRMMPLHVVLSLAPLAGMVFATSSDAQEQMKQVPGFEPGRAILSDRWGFDPFPVTTMSSLSDALDEGRVGEETGVLVLTRGDTRLTLLTEQMAYHHIAQGEIAGEPWMVSF